jgi:hypothetical protein
VTRRQRAMSSLRASATIIVLRVLRVHRPFALETIGPGRCPFGT